MSIYSQIKNLNIYSQKSELTDEDKEKISGAYYYLQYTEKGKKYIKDNLNKEQINTITNYKQTKGYYGYKNYKSLYLNNNNYDRLEIKGYNYISKIETSSYSRNQEQSLEKAFSNIEFKTKSNKVKTNIYPKIKEFIEKKEVLSENEMNNYFDNNNEIIINQNQKLIIYYLSINYDENDLVDNYNINAYLLEK